MRYRVGQIKYPSFERLLGKVKQYLQNYFLFYWDQYTMPFVIRSIFKDNIMKMVAIYSIHFWRRYLKFSAALRHISRGIVAISSRILILNSSNLCDRLLNTFSFRYPHWKKSKMLKSGEHGGHLISPVRETRRVGKICRNLTISTLAVWDAV